MRRSSPSRLLRLFAFITLGLLSLAHFAVPVLAQPGGNEICGDGTTFTVQLPGTSLGIDNSDGFFRSMIVPNPGPDDSITLPNGCSLYVLVVAGYRQNEFFDQIIFYQVAEFAAKNNGYVHVAWWNNLLKEYMGGPLHPFTVIIERFFPLLFPDLLIPPSPGGYAAIRDDVGLFLPGNFLDLPKANPGSDEQFQSDAALMIQAIKAHNPDALIVVAGHSMGGDSAARLGRNPALPIDLLALIDPSNNQDLPRGRIGQRHYNWTRWRATHDFRGFQQWDCVRGPLGFCQDFDPRLFVFQPNCFVAPTFHLKPPLPSLAPVHCPALLPVADPGTLRRFGTNVKRLYHRWQQESFPPFDFERTERFGFPYPLTNHIEFRGFQLGFNYQHPILQNSFQEGDPNKTCGDIRDVDPLRLGSDQFGLPFFCRPWDGHGEIVGYRGSSASDPNLFMAEPGLGMRNWRRVLPSQDGDADIAADVAAFRRDRMIELATADATWPYRPEAPDTCMVCDDIIAIIVHLLAQQPGPPAPTDTFAAVSLALASPGPNANGWNSGDVVITISAVDEADGSGVKEIEHSLTGAQFGRMVTAGDMAQETITAEGTTTLAFFARDNAANVELPKALDVNIDKTPPDIAAVTDVQPNPNGWIKQVVLVRFPASDALSGLAFSSPDVQVSSEGAGQDITGTAEDNAGNRATAIVTLNIDKTAPQVTGTPSRSADRNGWYNHALTVAWSGTDALSGIAGCSTDSNYNGPDSANASVSGSCSDLADNSSQANVHFQFDGTPPAVQITTPANGAGYLLNAVVNSAYACTDNLSGVEPCSGPVASGGALHTSSVGNHPFTVNSNDVAGNNASVTHPYTVQYAFSGFSSPIVPMPMLNVAKAGRTVPVKYQLQDAHGAFIADPGSFASLVSHAMACDAAPQGVLSETTDAAGRTTIRFDAGTNQFVYNWKTDGAWAGSCRTLQLTLNDGTTHLALFEFK